MKKYYEYDAPVLTKLLSVVAVIAICVSMATSALCCYKVASMQTGTAAVVDNGSNSNNGQNGNNNSQNTTPTPTQDNTKTPTDGNNNSETPADGNDNAAAGGLEGLSTNEEILAKYTEVMNDAKKAKPAFKKVEFQSLPEEFRKLGTVGNVILPIAEGFMTTEEKAKADPQVKEAGSDMHAWPVTGHDTAGCLLTDASKIKSASAVKEGDNVKITITLLPEENPEPINSATATSSPSFTGGMFSPMSKADIDNTIAGIKGVKVNSFNLTYTDCTVTLVYNPSDNHVVTLDQIMNVDIKANIKVLATIDGSARLVDTINIWDIQY